MESPDWKKINQEKRKEIFFGQAVKIAADTINYHSDRYEEEIILIYNKICSAHDKVFGDKK
jgi:hypothetical protein